MALYSVEIDDPEKGRLVRRLLEQWGYEEISRNRFARKAAAETNKPVSHRKSAKE